MGSFVKRVVMGILGVALTLGFWTVKGWFLSEADATTPRIPDKVWEGGGGTVVIEVETTEPARVTASFENSPDDEADHRYLETWDRVEPGLRTYKVEVPPGVFGTVEAGIDAPRLGSRVRVAVKVDGATVVEDIQTLTEPPQSGYAFFAQVSLADYAAGTPAED